MISNQTGLSCPWWQAYRMMREWSRVRSAQIRSRINRRMANGTMRSDVLNMQHRIRDQLRVSGKWLATDALTMMAARSIQQMTGCLIRDAWRLAYRETRIKHKRDLEAFVKSIVARPSPGTRQDATQAVRTIAGENAAIEFKDSSIIIYCNEQHMRQVADAVGAAVPMGIYIGVRRLSHV